ncbi:MAG TPA: uroporphyrinogen-III C-methyltransferase [Candidatus Baltobacteraceae bacterium]|jgi:uroporphyrinogen III methyltransferase/synthase|nr:uroporphyrinogen-III C-methyltransferase [Candidatus Baltobacteraceae bacterium]
MPATPRRGKVILIGAGPGDPGLITVKGARAIAQAEVLVYDALASEPIISLAPAACERIDVGKRAGRHTMPQDEIITLLVRLAREGRRVVRLKGGDVFVFARGGEEAAALQAAGIPFEIIPGITSAIAVPAYAGIPLTHRDHNTSFTVATGHEDPTKGISTLDFAKLANPSQTLVLLMAMGNLRAICTRLIEHGLPAETPAAVIHEGTTPRQRSVSATLETIAEAAEQAGIGAPAVVVIGNVAREAERLRWFDTSPLFGARVLLTRPRAQADEISARLWELGAEPVIAPCIAIEPPNDGEAAVRAVASVRSYDWLVFTSQNGVKAFFAILDADKRDARALGDVRVAAIGSTTAEALQKHGVRADLVPSHFIGETFADELIERSAEGERLLFFQAQEAREILSERLRGAKRHVDVVAAYQTRIVRDDTIAEAARTCDVWTFASASSVDGLAVNLPNLAKESAGKRIACIGPITAQAAQGHGLHVDMLAEEHSLTGLLDILENDEGRPVRPPTPSQSDARQR